MSFLDRIVAAITPLESDEERARARSEAEALAGGTGWLALALEHHRRIEGCFELARNAATAAERQAACRDLAHVLVGHASAEELVLYPAMTEHGEKGHATLAYEEQAMTKVQMAALEKLDPMGDEWREKLEHIRGAVLHHIYTEEHTWFPQLRAAVDPSEDAMLTARFTEEFEKYTRGDALVAPAIPGGSPTEPPRSMAGEIDDSNRQPGAQNWGAADY